jgi:uncharacterized protein YjbI with pentapeptide repeats
VPRFASRDVQDLEGMLVGGCLHGSDAQRVDLTGSALYERAVLMLMYGVAGFIPGQRANLGELNLSECPFGDHGARHLAGALTINSTLRTLNVSACGLTGESGG